MTNVGLAIFASSSQAPFQLAASQPIPRLNCCSRLLGEILADRSWVSGGLGRDRVCYLYTGNIELSSDILGIAYYMFENKVREYMSDI